MKDNLEEFERNLTESVIDSQEIAGGRTSLVYNVGQMTSDQFSTLLLSVAAGFILIIGLITLAILIYYNCI